MKTSRLETVILDGTLPVSDGHIAVFRPTIQTNLRCFSLDQLLFDQSFYPDHKVLLAQGFQPLTDEACQMVVVCPTKSKAESRGMIARACTLSGDGVVVVDGQKTDGIESLYKDARKRVQLQGMLSKAHGRVFWFSATSAFGDWTQSAPIKADHGFFTAPGMFSPDAIDKGSQVLVDHLPPLKGRVADLGAGWGYLSSHLQNMADISQLHLIEAEKTALDCARMNVMDERAYFHWADARNFTPAEPFHTIVSNPPFHAGRSADPDLGRAFIQSASRMLIPNGQFIMVANRHLPYEAALSDAFRHVEEIGGNAGFKIIRAQRASRTRG